MIYNQRARGNVYTCSGHTHNGTAEERKEMVRLVNEIVDGWQEMEGKDKVVCVVDKACENGRVRKEVERLYRND